MWQFYAGEMSTHRAPSRRIFQVLFILGGVTLFMMAVNIVKYPLYRQIDIFPSAEPFGPSNSGIHRSQSNISEKIQSIRMCTQAERIAHVKHVCRRRYEVNRPELLVPSGRSLVDHKNKVTLCWMSKSGGTSLKAFVLEANGLDLSKRPNQGDSLNMVHNMGTINKYGLHQMKQLNQSQRLAVVDTYTNVMGIRHPFDRLVAYYRDKIQDNDTSSNRPRKAAEILRAYRSHLFESDKKLSSMKRPQDAIGLPTFAEVFRWAYEHKEMDEHWNFIHEVCHPCAHDWGAILRVETMQTDGELLAKLVHSNHSGVPVRHSHESNSNYSQFGKVLDQFADLPSDILDYFLEFYRTDMIMFGYKWDNATRTAYCSIDTPNGPCC